MDKKEQFQEDLKEKNKNSPLVFIISFMVVAVIAVGSYLLAGKSDGTTYINANNGEYQIPLAELDDGKAHFYCVKKPEGDVTFFLVKSNDGKIRSAFDTCDVCYKERKGYRQEGNQMVCNKCNQSFPISRINEVKGGCNPAPLQSIVRSGNVVIQTAALDRGAWYFKSQQK